MPGKREKVRLAILDKDLRARTFRKFPITDGGRIDVINSGKGYFMPRFDNDSCIKLPYRSLATPWKQSWNELYVAIRGADACVRFRKISSTLGQKIKTTADLQEVVIAAFDKENPNQEAKQQIDEILSIIEASGNDDYLKQDPEQIMDAAGNKILKGIGSEEKDSNNSYLIIMILLIVLGIALKVFGVIV